MAKEFWTTYNASLAPEAGDTVRLCYTDDTGQFRNPGITGHITKLRPLTVEWQSDAHRSFFEIVPAPLEPRHLELLCEMPEGVPVRIY